MKKNLKPKVLITALAVIVLASVLHYNSLNSKRERYFDNINQNAVIFDSGQVYLNYMHYTKDTLETFVDIKYLEKITGSSYKELLQLAKDNKRLNMVSNTYLSKMPFENLKEPLSLEFSHYRLVISDLEEDKPFYYSQPINILHFLEKQDVANVDSLNLVQDQEKK